MRLFFPENRIVNSTNELKEIVNFNKGKLSVFDETTVKFFDDLSKYLLGDKKLNKIPELAAFAFWIRKSNIKNFLSEINLSDNIIFVPRGVVFHIAPSNVDYLFLYSWFISILCGNKNILRLSSTYDYNIVHTINAIISFANRNKADWFLNYNVIINYEHNDEINNLLSLSADCRIFWGGDETIKRMRRFDSKTTVKDIYFADKFSYSIINSEKYLKSEINEKEKLANYFFNDSYLFNQKACSSPQVVFFAGNISDNKEASELFWEYLSNVLKQKNSEKSNEVLMEHYLNWYLLAANSEINNFSADSVKPTVANLKIENISSSYRTCGGGFFIESFIKDFSELLYFNSESDQTLSYYGFNKNEISKYVLQKGSNSNLRIVSIGKALNFDVFWDGYNLMYELIKIIKIN